jgi:hypothetical protein
MFAPNYYWWHYFATVDRRERAVVASENRETAASWTAARWRKAPNQAVAGMPATEIQFPRLPFGTGSETKFNLL